MDSSRPPKYRRIFKIFVFFSLAYGQIWLIPLIDDHQCDYITKWEKTWCSWQECSNLARDLTIMLLVNPHHFVM
jgi:hypothetical protein